MSTAAQRYLLCRPHGGLNDSLAVINACWGSAQRTGRVLVIDGVRSAFAPRWEDYFELRTPSPEMVIGLSRPLLHRMNAMPCAPQAVEGRLDSYEVDIQLHETFSHLDWRLPVEARTRVPVHIDLALDHDEPLVVHEVYGGAPGSIDLLGRFRLTPRVRRRVMRRLRRLPAGDYVGLHIRHSDLQTDYAAFVTERADALVGRTVVVCSDDGAVIPHVAALLPRSRVVTVSAVPPAGGVPYQADVHTSPRAQRKVAIDTLVDLLALGMATEVLFPAVINSSAGSSGFSRLARDLAARPEVVDGLLAGRLPRVPPSEQR